MHLPRRPAVVLSALALTGSLAACSSESGAGADEGTAPAVTDEVAPGGGTEGGEVTGDEPIGDVTVPEG